jgi:hypothetical protein
VTAPALFVQQQGNGAVGADNMNTWLQGCDTISQLRAFIGIQGLQVYCRGNLTAGDGGGGNYYWVSGSTVGLSDNGTTIIIPSGASSGYWSRLGGGGYTYLTPLTGTSITFGTYVKRLILNPAGALAALTIVLPASPPDGWEAYIASTASISALTISPNSGQSIANAASSLSSGAAIGYQWVAGQATWYRIQ